MRFLHRIVLVLLNVASAFLQHANAQKITELDQCNITWNSQSKNSSESMPCGGGDIGLNVWVENDELLFYITRSGTFDETNDL